MTRGPLIAALWPRRWAIGLALAIAAGAVFRLIWVSDMEYKPDEAWTFTQVQAFWQTHHLLTAGMVSSTGVPNGGMSLWIFIALSSIVPGDDPLALARAVQLVNIAAILVLAVFALKAVEPTEREPWLWSVALISVNPLSVLFSRKIWPPDLFCVFTLVLLIGWWHRQRWWGAFFWGMLGAILGQVELIGFLFTVAIAGCTTVFDRGSARWRLWLAGTIAGAIPMIPWLLALRDSTHQLSPAHHINLLSTFIQHWIELSLGSDLRYSLGDSMSAFLAYPALGGAHLYLGSTLLAIIGILFLIILTRLALRLWARPSTAMEVFFGVKTPTALILTSAFWVYGLALTATLQPIRLHYFIIAFSLPMLWLARLELAPSPTVSQPNTKGRLLLSSLVLVQACLTICFLSFIHETQVIQGDYNTVYHALAHPGK